MEKKSPPMTAKWIYSLRLHNGCWYVGVTDDHEARLQSHLKGTACAWTHIHKPTEAKFASLHCCKNDMLAGFEEDAFTKQLMAKHGIYKVRGGSYSKVSLDIQSLTVLNREIKHARNQCLICGSFDHYISQCKEQTHPFILHDITTRPLRNADLYGHVELEQKGAGSGKTYGALRRINDHYKMGKCMFVMLSKTCAAIGVFKEAIDNDLVTFEFVHSGKWLNSNEAKQECKEEGKETKQGTQKRPSTWKIYIAQHIDGEYFVVACGTLDSFLYQLCCDEQPENEKGSDMFVWRASKIAKNTCSSVLCRSSLISAISRPIEDCKSALHNSICKWKKAHVVIDEAQDVDSDYVIAVANTCLSGASLSVIGDKLQSVYETKRHKSYHSQSALALGAAGIKSQYKDLPIQVAESAPTNKVRRCTNKYWPGILSKIIDFPKFGTVIPRVPSVLQTSQDEIEPVLVISSLYKTNIQEILQAEYNNGFTKPEHFLVIFGFITNHPDRNAMEQEASEFWKEKGAYENKTDDYHSVFSHCAQNYGPIDTNKSIDKMRFMSVQGSKGSQRPIVILWDYDDQTLRQLYCQSSNKEEAELRHESLCHVAVTRHQRRLHVVISNTSEAALNMLALDSPAVKITCCESLKSCIATSYPIIRSVIHPGSSCMIECKKMLNDEGVQINWNEESNIDASERTFSNNPAHQEMLFHALRSKAALCIGNLAIWAFGDGLSKTQSRGMLRKNMGGVIRAISVSKGSVYVDKNAKNLIDQAFRDQRVFKPSFEFPVRKTRLQELLNCGIWQDVQLYCKKLQKWANTMNFGHGAAFQWKEYRPTPTNAIVLQYFAEVFGLFGSGHMTEQDFCLALESLQVTDETSTYEFMQMLDNVYFQVVPALNDFVNDTPRAIHSSATSSQKAAVMMSEHSGRGKLPDRMEPANGMLIAISASSSKARIIPIFADLSEMNFLEQMTGAVTAAACYHLNNRDHDVDIYPISLNANIESISKTRNCVHFIDCKKVSKILKMPVIWKLLENDVSEKARSVLSYARIRTQALHALDRSKPHTWIRVQNCKNAIGKHEYVCTFGECTMPSNTLPDAINHWFKNHQNTCQESVEKHTIRAMRTALEDGACCVLKNAVDDNSAALETALKNNEVCEDVVQWYKNKWKEVVQKANAEEES